MAVKKIKLTIIKYSVAQQAALDLKTQIVMANYEKMTMLQEKVVFRYMDYIENVMF
jgi:hypothetical protein